jgi:hypothetical protein
MAAVLAATLCGVPAADAAEEADTTAPVIGDIGIVPGTHINKLVTLQPVVSDDVAVTQVVLRVNHGNVASARSAPWSLSWNSGAVYDQNVLIEVVAYDAAGNKSTSPPVTVYVDNHGPLVYFPWFFSGSSNPSPTMSFTGTVPIDFRKWGFDPDLAKIEVSIGSEVIGVADAEPWTIDWDTTAYQGKTTLVARSWDTSGNVATSTTKVWADHTGPTTDVEFDFAEGYVRANGSVFVTVNDPAWISKVELLVNGTVVSTRNGGDQAFALPWDRKSKNGPATMVIRAYDSIGNVSEYARTVIVDNDRPTANVAPAAGTKVRGTLTAPVTSSRDATGLAYLTVGLDGAQPFMTRKAPWTGKVDTRSYRDGWHTLAWDLRDKAGNQTLIKRSVIVDNTKPTVGITKAPKNKSKLRGTTRINGSARDTYGINRVELLINGKVIAVDRKAGYTFTFNPKKYGKKFTVQLRAYDQAGNAKYSSKRSYRR